MAGAGFVGRVAELERLGRELDATAQGSSRVLVIDGPAGVGKTRLVEEFRRRTRLRARWLAGRGSPLAATLPFSAVAEGLESHLRTLAPAAVVALSRPHGTALASLIPSVATALGDPSAAVPSRLGMLEAFTRLLAALAAERPVVLFVDDLHQTDPSTWDLVGYVARSPIAAPVLVVVACRTEELNARMELSEAVLALVRDGLAAEVRVEPLAVDDVATLAEQVIGSAQATAELTRWVYERTRGNALFTAALLDDIARDPARRSVPATIRERVRALTAPLPDEARQVLEAAAVLGARFEVAAIVGLVPEGAEQWLDELTRRGLLTEPSAIEIGAYDFSHPLVQEAVYEDMGAMRRRALHRRAADALAAQPLPVRAYHAARGAIPGDVAALDLVTAAARDAEVHQLHRQAAGLLQAALSLSPAGSPQRTQLLDELAWQAGCVGDHAAGVPALRELEGLVRDDAEARAGAKMRLASLLAWGQGDLDAAHREAIEAVDLLSAAGADLRRAAALNELAWIDGARGDIAAQVTGSRAALELAEQLGGAEQALHARGGLGAALIFGDSPDAGIEILRRGVEASRSGQDVTQLDWFTAVLADGLGMLGRFDDADAAIAAFHAAGFRPVDLLPSRAAVIDWWRGRWSAALANCRASQAMAPGAAPIHSAWAETLAGLLEVAMGNRAAAMPHLAQGERTYGGRPLFWFSARHDWAFGLAQWLLGDTAAAVTHLNRAAAATESMGAVTVGAQMLPDIIEVLADAGDIDEATAYHRRLRDFRSLHDGTHLAGQCAYAHGVLLAARGQQHEAQGAFTAAAAAAELVGTPFVRARSLEHLARCVPPSQAVSPLSDAARIYATLPAPLHEARVRTRLRDLGPAGRRSARSLADVTPREQEVLALARRGLTAREIAARIHVSERTVETHLAHIYQKLGVSGRRELLAERRPG